MRSIFLDINFNLWDPNRPWEMLNCQTPQPQRWTQWPEMDFAFKWELTNQRSLLRTKVWLLLWRRSKHSHSLPGELGNFRYTSESLIHKEMLSDEPAVTFCSRRQTSVHDDIVLFTTKNFLRQGSTVDFFFWKIGSTADWRWMILISIRRKKKAWHLFGLAARWDGMIMPSFCVMRWSHSFVWL